MSDTTTTNEAYTEQPETIEAAPVTADAQPQAIAGSVAEALPESTPSDAPDASVGVDAVEQPADDGVRPWHGAVNPMEALYQHFHAEIATLKAKLSA